MTVTDADGVILASGTGTTAAVDWTWDARSYGRGKYFWTISAGSNVRPATGTLGGNPPPISISGVSAQPPVISPNGDGVDDYATISYTLNAPATVTAALLDADGNTVSTLFADELHGAGPQSFVFDGDGVPDGSYTIAIAARANGKTVTVGVPLEIAR
jgi:hypothetical protein